MAGLPYTTNSTPVGDKEFNGGLNSTAGPLELKNNESGDLLNIDFDKFGSILKRNGYATLSTATAASTEVLSDGLYWYEYTDSGTTTRQGINVTNGKLMKMDGLDGEWDDVSTSYVTITSANHCDFETFNKKLFFTNGQDLPVVFAGTGTAFNMPVPVGLTAAKYIKAFNNYLFLGNVTVSGIDYPTRIYWSDIRDYTTWESDQWIEVAMNDGQVITGLKVLQDRLVVYKERSIYNVFFSGDADIPFIMPGGGKSNSSVGCIAPWSIQELENGHVFLSADGLYYYDGSNSYKLSYKVQATLDGLNDAYFSRAVSLVYKPKNRYLIALPDASSQTNKYVLVWDYYNNAFSIYDGIEASAMSTFFVGGYEERPYFSDYSGYTYRMDYGTNDYPLDVATAIDAYYWTNWKAFDDLCDQKGVPNVYVYFQANNATLTFSYSYDFDDKALYNLSFSTASGTALYGTAVYGTDTYAGTGGNVKRQDLTGRGRVVRFKFANSTASETFRIDGLGSYVHVESNV